MSKLIDIATMVPEFSVTKEDLLKFYTHSLQSESSPSVSRKLKIIADKTRIEKRFSCVPDFNQSNFELFEDSDFLPSIEERTKIYRQKALPLAIGAIQKLFDQTGTSASDYTHLITVTCTGVIAPGLEFLVAEQLGLQHTEKLGINYLGCYAALKALKHANYIANAVPNACIAIICVELCSLHFVPSINDEDILANLLFADGCAAALVCGNESIIGKEKASMNIDAVGSSFVPNTKDQMTWSVSSTAFRMFLSKEIVGSIRSNIAEAVNNFLSDNRNAIDHWAIHPGGVRIVEAVQESLCLSNENVSESLNVLEQFGNMSSPTILFILERIFSKIKIQQIEAKDKIFACAFGPGLNIEMLLLSFNAENLSSVSGKIENKDVAHA